uniref:DUF5648 domain-containing protein n=1 Tax=Mycena chlorophos TaxID=658473 RepID=A0ABQ0LJN1_MYCCL|nr:predicted protein [Mycena chlorophos]
MRAFSPLLALFAATVSGMAVVAPDVQYQVVLNTNNRFPDCPQSSAEPTKLVRLFNADTETFMYSTAPGFGTEAEARDGYEFDAVAASVFLTPQPSTVPFYHLLNKETSTSFYTRHERERDAVLAEDPEGLLWVDHGVAAYVFPRRMCGAKPFYRAHNMHSGSWFFSTSEQELDQMVANEGYTTPAIAGFVLLA